MFAVIAIIIGLLLLFVGGEGLVKGAVEIARRLGISPIVVGLTIVALGTSAPEIIISIIAQLEGHAEVAVGNIIGSNIANIFLVLALSAIIKPVKVEGTTLKYDIPALLLITGLFMVFAFQGVLKWYEGAALLAILVFYVGTTIRSAKKNKVEYALEDDSWDLWKAGTVAAVGCILLAFGGRLLLDGSVQVASMLGLSEAFIGSTIVAIGSCAPEIVTCVIASLRGHNDIVIGNVVGSNILNILLGVTAATFVAPLPIATEFLRFDIWMLGFATLIFFTYAIGTRQFGRLIGVVFLLGYVGYILGML